MIPRIKNRYRRTKTEHGVVSTQYKIKIITKVQINKANRASQKINHSK